MTRQALWDANAAKQIGEQELDKLFEEEKKHYIRLAADTWKTLRSINEDHTLLKHDDLFDVLRPVIERDAKTIAGFGARNLPGPGERLWTRWHEWFTHYIVERFLEQEETE